MGVTGEADAAGGGLMVVTGRPCGTVTDLGHPDGHAIAPVPRGRGTAGAAARAMVLGGLGLMLAACSTTAPGTGLFGGFDPDLRGRFGGGLDTSGGAGAAAPGGGGVVDPFAGQGVNQPDIPPAGSVKAAASTPTPSTSATAAAATTTRTPSSGGAAPELRPAKASSHTVASGETAWSISRKYGVSINDLASANNLPADTMTVRTGQVLTIPGGPRFVQSERVTAPGSGSPTPEPPSASKPLPREDTAPASAPVKKPAAPDLGATRTKASGGSGRFQMPVAGSIVRTYAKGRSEGIDISAPRGTTVKAAGGGTVAAITRDTDGVPIVVVRHDGQLMTVYAGLDDLTVAKGDKVSSGQALGKSSSAGILHFEVRQGFDSVDPETYLR